MIAIASSTDIYLAVGPTDMRKSIDGLAAEVRGRLNLDPLSGAGFVFCNRRGTVVKLLMWDRHGFWLLQRRLERGRFQWPRSRDEFMKLSGREILWLLDGLDLRRLALPPAQHYDAIY